jgi:DNA-binding transcriptional ArsR family regulator
MSKFEKSDLKKISAMFAALSNIHRLTIFCRLAECAVPGSDWDEKNQIPRCVGAISKDLDIVASTASHHIKELANAGLIVLDRDGQRVLCSINHKALEILDSFFSFRK